jgi:hypothetical protein
MFLLHHQEQQLGLQALMQQRQQLMAGAAAAAAATPPPRAGSPTDCGCTSSMSDGAAVTASTAAAAAAAAAAAQASNCALSAPLLLLDGHTTSQQQQQPKQEHTYMDAGGTQPCVADSDGMLDGIMAQSEVEEALRAGQDPAGSWGQVPQQQQEQGGGKQVTFAQQEASGCSIPLANLALSAAAPHSPVGSGMTGGCKSAPLPRWHTLTTMSAMAAQAVRAASAAAGEVNTGWPQQQQQHSGRLRWLLQQVQQELHTCSPAELDSLDNAELSTLLCAALAPEAVAAAAADGGGDASPSAVTAAAESYIARAAAAACSGAKEASAGFGAAAVMPPASPAHAGLAAQVEQVQQLQQQVEHLQLQLARAKESQAVTRAHCMPGLNGAAAAPSLPQAAGCGFHAPPPMARTVSAAATQGKYSPVSQAPLPKARSSAATLAAAVADAALSSELPPLHRAGSSTNMAARSLHGGGSGAFNNHTNLPAASASSWGGFNMQLEARHVQAQVQMQQQLQWEQLVGFQQQLPGASAQQQQQLQQADAIAQFARLQRQLEATETDISTLLRQRAGNA